MCRPFRALTWADVRSSVRLPPGSSTPEQSVSINKAGGFHRPGDGPEAVSALSCSLAAPIANGAMIGMKPARGQAVRHIASISADRPRNHSMDWPPLINCIPFADQAAILAAEPSALPPLASWWTDLLLILPGAHLTTQRGGIGTRRPRRNRS